MEIGITCEGVEYPEEERLLDDAGRILLALGWGDGELSIVLGTDDFIQGLNRDYRSKDEPTDVLSFAMQEETESEWDSGAIDENVLGDVVISLETAARQAREQGHVLHTELQVLLVHGILHLLGFDHLEPEEAVEMRTEEDRLLKLLEPGTRSLIERGQG
jgi:probable rRNA maturation factor